MRGFLTYFINLSTICIYIVHNLANIDELECTRSSYLCAQNQHVGYGSFLHRGHINNRHLPLFDVDYYAYKYVWVDFAVYSDTSVRACTAWFGAGYNVTEMYENSTELHFANIFDEIL